jgi:predicted house-cleaning NTP pyrophosphatase (Maf/HAM1 superfamily)
LAYGKDDPAAAAKVMDLVLSKAKEASAILRYKAFVLRADIAVSMDEINLAKAFINEADQLSLSDQELEGVKEETERLNELKVTLGY